jgi:hypothetical protein
MRKAKRCKRGRGKAKLVKGKGGEARKIKGEETKRYLSLVCLDWKEKETHTYIYISLSLFLQSEYKCK